MNNSTLKGNRSPKRFSEEKEQDIVTKYKEGMSQKDIADLYGTYNTSIRRVLLRKGVLLRSGARVRRLCKHNPFKKNDEKSEYFLGLLLTDGCISYRNGVGRLDLSLSQEDKYMIELFRNWISPKQKIVKMPQKLNNSYMYSVKVTNQETIEWLERKGNFHKKSYYCKLYCQMTWSILRGIFDGDGGFANINSHGLRFYICGKSEVFIRQIHYFLEKNNIKSFIFKTPPEDICHNGLYYISVYKEADVEKIGLNMYSNANIFLKRKYLKWLTFYENRRKKTP